jgi:hypothetical protein
MVGYHVNCKSNKEIKDPVEVTMKNGRKALSVNVHLLNRNVSLSMCCASGRANCVQSTLVVLVNLSKPKRLPKSS